MDIATPRGIIVTTLALLVITGMAPLGTATPQSDPGCPDDAYKTGKISAGNPLTGQISASELVYFMARGEHEALERTNGIDAYVVDLGWERFDELFCLERTNDQGGTHEFHIRYFDAAMNPLTATDADPGEDLLGANLPDGARYMVIELEQAPTINSFHASHGIGFYALEFELGVYS